MTFNSRRHDVKSIEHNICLFGSSLDYVFHVGKCLYRQMKTVALSELIEGKTLALWLFWVFYFIIDNNIYHGFMSNDS